MKQAKRAGRASGFLVDEGGWLTLIGMLITIAIIAILAVLLLGGTEVFQPGGKSGPGGGGRYGGAIAAKDQAKKQVCRNNLEQARYALQIYQTNGEGYPAGLDDLAKASPGLQLDCPVGKQPYEYDASSGRIWCSYPGHERL